MASPSARVLLGVALGFCLLVAGYGSTSVAHQWNQACHEEWDDRNAAADCEDGLYVVMFYGGTLFGTFGVALLAAAGYEHWSASDEQPAIPRH
jgi:hypothetical protein